MLGVNTSATYTDIKIAFRRMAIRLHPDTNPSRHATKEFAVLSEAYRVLMAYRSPFQRNRYKSKSQRSQRTALVKL